MVPTLNVGDLIIVQGIQNASEINAAPKPNGTIIVFHKSNDPGELIVHRAVDKNFKDGVWYFTTQGDANLGGSAGWETNFPETLIVGKVVGVVPWIGNVPLFIRTTQGLILIVFLFVIVLLIEYIPVVLKKPKTEKQGIPEGGENSQG
jgi:signal peptidase I